MAVHVEGIGGSGKGVVNLLEFFRQAAAIVGQPAPQFSLVAIDQDAGGLWADIQCHRPVLAGQGTFANAIGALTPRDLSAAQLLFTEAELRTDVTQGFHGYPKLSAALRHLLQAVPPTQENIHAVVYSDIGGTGAGFGPVRLITLLDSPQKTHVVAVVFGRYLTSGAANPVGLPWLHLAKLTQHAAGRWFTAFYINVPPLSLTRGNPPVNGLNNTPALAMAAAYLWRLAEAAGDTDGVNKFLGLNARAQRREVIETVQLRNPQFAVDGLSQTAREAQDFPAILRRWATTNRLEVPTPSAAQARHFRELISHRNSPAPASWEVLASPEPAGVPTPLEFNWAGAFAETFASVPNPLAAAVWFHRAVRAGADPTCRDAFRRLVALFVQDKLHVYRTGWTPPDGTELYALTTRRLDPVSPDFERHFRQSVVGAFSESIPFWTTPAFLPALNAAAVDRVAPQSIAVRLRAGDIAADCYELSESTPPQPFLIQDSQGVPYNLELTAVPTGNATFDWYIDAECERWEDMENRVARLPILAKHLDVFRSSMTVGSYTCAIRGLYINDRVLPVDAVQTPYERGTGLYEVAANYDGKQDTSRVLNLQNDPQGRASVAVLTTDVTLTLGNVRAVFTL
jgi:hypothetical protein